MNLLNVDEFHFIDSGKFFVALRFLKRIVQEEEEERASQIGQKRNKDSLVR